VPGSVPISVSPDKRWLVFFGVSESDKKTVAFSYNLASDTLINLGVVRNDGYLGLSQWVDATTILIETSTGLEQFGSAYSVADITRPNNVQFTLWSRFQAFYYNNPPRVESLYSRAAWAYAEDFGRPCIFEVYYLISRQYMRINYDDLCVAEYGTAIGVG